MKNLKTIIWIIVIIGVLAFIKIKFLSPKQEGPAGGPTKGGSMSPSPVTVFIVSPQKLDNKVFSTGTLIANEEAILTPEIAGKITTLRIKEGSMVKQGDLLVKINDADYQAQLKKLMLQATIANERVGRQKQLLTISGISQEEYDVSVNELNTLKADIDYLKAQIAKTEIRAPFNGTIGLKYISEGSYVNSNTRIASIIQTNPIKVDFSIPEKYAEVLTKNDVLNFTVTGNAKTFKAKVYAVEPKIDLATRSILLRAITENNHNELIAGAFAKIELPLSQIKDALMIPTEAIIPVLKGKKVFVCRNGKAQQVDVETGIRTDALIQIVKGLSAGDSVITTGFMQLKPDSPVKAIKTVSTKQ